VFLQYFAGECSIHGLGRKPVNYNIMPKEKKMSVLPEKVSKAWDKRKGPIIFSSVDENRVPKANYATCVNKFIEDALVKEENFF